MWTVTKYMNTKIKSVYPDTLFETLFCSTLCPEPDHVYVTDQEGILMGMLTTYDILKGLVPSYLTSHLTRALADDLSLSQKAYTKSKDLTAADIMTSNVISLREQDNLLKAVTIILETGIKALPVIDGQSRILGEVTRCDAVRYLGQNFCSLHETHLQDHLFRQAQQAS